ncbi:hypothetical protein GCM10022396_39620 [Flavivirga amylovorans]
MTLKLTFKFKGDSMLSLISIILDLLEYKVTNYWFSRYKIDLITLKMLQIKMLNLLLILSI